MLNVIRRLVQRIIRGRTVPVVEHTGKVTLILTDDRVLVVRYWSPPHGATSLLTKQAITREIQGLCPINDEDRLALAKTIARECVLNAVEVTDDHGTGVVYYPEWP